jgi:hypothetical protein
MPSSGRLLDDSAFLHRPPLPVRSRSAMSSFLRAAHVFTPFRGVLTLTVHDRLEFPRPHYTIGRVKHPVGSDPGNLSPGARRTNRRWDRAGTPLLHR